MSTFRRPSAELVVKRLEADDMKAKKTARDRFTSNYSAGTEVGVILREAARGPSFVTQQGPGMKGAQGAAILEHAGKVRNAVATSSASGAVQGSWSAVAGVVDTIGAAFHQAW